MDQEARCELCGELMPPGEEIFKYHGYSGPCPKDQQIKDNTQTSEDQTNERPI